MSPEWLLLAVIEACEGRIEGRSYVQDLAYFVAKELGLPMGYRPDYYGPYSRVLSAELDSAVARGFLSELRERSGGLVSRGNFNGVRHTYTLTRDGLAYLAALELRQHEAFPRIQEVVQRVRKTGADCRQLSCAAKVDDLLARAGGTITRRRAKQQAQRLGWTVSDTDIEIAADVLQELGIAHRRAKVPQSAT